MQRLNFLTGLPRSGSTLLAAILRQNPAIEAGMTTPVGALTRMMRLAMSQNLEIDARLTDRQRINILRGVFDGYYRDCDRPIIFDTNRDWSARVPELLSLFDEVKLIAMVRDPAWIIDSLERIIRRDPLRQSRVAAPGANLDRRIEGFLGHDGILGAPMAALREVMFSDHATRLLVVEYDALCADPARILEQIYRFFDIPPHAHDFNHVEYREDGFDEVVHTPGLHTVSGPVRETARQTILPPDVFERASASAFWRRDITTGASRILLGGPDYSSSTLRNRATASPMS